MRNLPITLSDYANSQANDQAFAGGGSMEDLNQLQKALEAGEITGRDTTNSTTDSGAPLKVESLDKTLKHLTFSKKDIVFWQNIPKKAAYNTVEEYNQLVSYGADRGGFNNEGELPQEEDSTYVRRAQLVKFLGVTKSVTHPMQLVNTMVGNVVQREIENGTLWILRKLDKALFFGDETIIPQEFNGFLAQQARSDSWSNLNDYNNSSNVIDCRGQSLKETFIESAANSIIENFGLGDQLYAPPAVLSNFVKNFYGNKFIQPNSPALSDGIMGQKVRQFDSQFGTIGLNWDLFFQKLPTKLITAAATSANAPSTPTVGGAPIAAIPVDSLSKWSASDAGNYFYAVSALNRFGESGLLSLSNVATAIVNGGAVDLEFTATAGPNATTGFRIYRSKKDVAAFNSDIYYPLFDISLAELTSGYDGGGAGFVRDRDRVLPNCDQALLVQQNNEVIEFAQLAPLMKMDLAVLSPAYRFMCLLYGTPFLYAPKKMVRLINIGVA
jgi:hypothetical protein